MTPGEQFKLGFLARCAEEGCTIKEAEHRAKLAFGWPEAAINTAKEYYTFPLWYTLLASGAAGAAGYGGGYALGKAKEQDITPEDARHQEMLAALQRHTEQARRSAARKQYRQAKPEAPRFM